MPHFIITCDGGSIGNHDKNVVSRGYGSFMIEIIGDKGSMYFQEDFGDGVTNNAAEYMSLIAALEHIVGAANSDHSLNEVTVRMDSQLVIGHLARGWKVSKKGKHLLPFVMKAQQLIAKFHRVTFDPISGDKMKQILGH